MLFRSEEAEYFPLRKPLALDEEISVVSVGSVDNPSDCVACCGTHLTGGADIYTRKKIDKLTEAARSYGAGGLVWIKLGNNDIKSSVNKFFDQDQLFDIASEFKAVEGDLILIIADKSEIVFNALSFLRRHIADEMGLLDDEAVDLLWVVDFPL